MMGGIVEWLKEDYVQDNVFVSATTGKVVRVANSDMTVGSSGMLTKQCASASGSCASGQNASEVPVAVMESKIQRSITSVIPGKLLSQIKQIKLVSKDGQSELYLSVHGVMRVVAHGSRCGTIVNFFTQIGVVTFDDDVSSVDAQAEAILVAAGFELAPQGVLGLGGRRLSSNVNALGYFNFFENYQWKCDSLPAPKYFPKPYQIAGTQVHPCLSKACDSMFRDTNGGKMFKPGVLNEESGLVSTFEEIANTTHTLRLTKFPNHPDWTFVEIIDFAHKSSTTYQLAPNGNAWFCENQNGSLFQQVEIDMASKFTVVFNGYNASNASVRESTLIPKDAEKSPVVIEYFDDKDTLLPKMLSFPNARENGFDVESVTIGSNVNLSDAAADAAMATYLNKVCITNETIFAQELAIPDQMKDDPFEENWNIVVQHLNYIEDEMEMVDGHAGPALVKDSIQKD
jgi:hypothetical protein